tara:strand:+ start:1806 stop:4457 length:2652 start_codon:yes stop_codon:yes gene_type:complete
MADPFILRERFQGKQSSSLSSASIVTGLGAAVPGSGAAQAGAELQGASDRLLSLFVKQRNTQNALLAKSNTTQFALAAQKEIQQIEKSLKWNQQKNSWGIITDPSGKEQSYYEAVSSRLGPLRNRFKVGEKYQDDAYESVSASFFQNTLLQAATRGLQLDADKIKKNYEIQIDSGANLFGIEIGEHLSNTDSIGESVDPRDLLRRVDKKVSTHITDLKDGGLALGKDAMEDLGLDTRSKYTESLLNQLLLKEDLSTAEQVLEIGLKQSVAYEKGKDQGFEAGMKLGGSLFFLDPTALKTIQKRISTLRGKLPPGLGRQATLHVNNALSAIEDGGNPSVHLSKLAIVRAKQGSSINIDFENNLMQDSIATASDFNIAKNKLTTTPLSQHGNLIEGFHNAHVGSLSSAYALRLESKLAEASNTLLKLYNKDPIAFGLQYDESVREATKKLNDAKLSGDDIKSIASLGENLIEKRLQFQRFYNPGSRKPFVHLSKEEIKSAILALNLDAPNVSPEDYDKHVDEMKKFFDQYGKYAGQIYNELRDPQKYMDYTGDKLNPAVAAALVYGDTEVAVRIITAYDQEDDLFDEKQWPDQTLQQLKQRINKSEELSQFMSSLGYVGYTDYSNNDFVGIFQSYVLSLAAQGNRRETLVNLDDYIQQAAHDLIDSKYAIYENKAGGFLGLGRDVHYLSIPKEDNRGNPYNHELSERAIKTMKENPALIDKNLTNEEIAMIKSNGIFINNEDGTGFSLAYGSDKGVIDGQIDFKWDEFNSDKYSELFSLIPNNFSEDVNETIQQLKDAYTGPNISKDKEVITYGKLPEDRSLVKKLLMDYAKTEGEHKKAIAQNNLNNARLAKEKINSLVSKLKAKWKHFIASQSARADMIKRNN